jgi:hypothetical protein
LYDQKLTVTAFRLTSGLARFLHNSRMDLTLLLTVNLLLTLATQLTFHSFMMIDGRNTTFSTRFFLMGNNVTGFHALFNMVSRARFDCNMVHSARLTSHAGVATIRICHHIRGHQQTCTHTHADQYIFNSHNVLTIG